MLPDEDLTEYWQDVEESCETYIISEDGEQWQMVHLESIGHVSHALSAIIVHV